MWSPRRLLLMVFSFALFLGAYQLYAFFLGHYDGLPPLPPEYRSTANGQVNISDNSERYVNRKHEINRMLCVFLCIIRINCLIRRFCLWSFHGFRCVLLLM